VSGIHGLSKATIFPWANKHMKRRVPSGVLCVALFHPDCDRRLRHLTGSADPSLPRRRSRAPSCLDTAGGELHPAL